MIFNRILAAVVVLLLSGCSLGTPSSSDARAYLEERLHAAVNGKAVITDFKKTDGLKSVRDGVDTYELDFIAKADMPGSQWPTDTYHGNIIFIHTENGWRPTAANATSEAETTARQKQEHDGAITARAKQEIIHIQTALELYQLDNSTYPSNSQGLLALIDEPHSEPFAKNWKPGGYLKKQDLIDPWGNFYQYSSPGAHGNIDIYTFGADNKSGGTLLNEDIGNWQLDN